MDKVYFFSDNTAPVHPTVMAALTEGNQGHAASYGMDEQAKKAQTLFEQMCGREVEVMYVLGGTGGNVLALDSLMSSHEALICTDCCHVHTMEAGAFEKIVRAKIYPVAQHDGKLDLAEAEKTILAYQGNFHHNQPAVISIAQTTEVGTVYTVEEIRAICALAHRYGLKVHMDGARISNALAYLGCTFKELCVDTKVDVVTFGGTKNGLMFGEANLYFDHESYQRAIYLQKQDLQMISKFRYVSLQFTAFLQDELYLKLAKHANDLIVCDLKEGLRDLPQVRLSVSLESNQAFLVLESDVVDKLAEKYLFTINQDFGQTKSIRLVTDFTTKKEDMAAFICDLHAIYQAR